MKENVLDVLMYLFQNDMDEDNETESDRDSIQTELVNAGFPSDDIQRAFDWLDSLTNHQPAPIAVHPSSHRVYVDSELARLDVECRGFLFFLEQQGVLASEARELVIDRVMALEADDMDLYQLKWIILMVLFNQPGQEQAYTWLEDVVFDEAPSYCH